MSRQDPEAQNLTADDFEYRSDEETTTTNARPARPAQQAFKSQYTIQTSERLKGVANRIIFSRYYILFYFIMMSLSLTTVVMSLMATHKGICPPKVWHILEIVINGMMVVEVSTRWVAYGKKYPMTILNVLDLLLVAFCSLTLMLVFIWPCSEGAREEEIFDTVLLVIRNAVQFLRLGNILRRSGHSVLNPPKPIDLSQARTASLALDLDLDLSDDEAVAERQLQGGSRRTLAGRGAGGYQPIFTDEVEEATERRPVAPANLAGRDVLAEEDEDLWDRVG